MSLGIRALGKRHSTLPPPSVPFRSCPLNYQFPLDSINNYERCFRKVNSYEVAARFMNGTSRVLGIGDVSLVGYLYGTFEARPSLWWSDVVPNNALPQSKENCIRSCPAQSGNFFTSYLVQKLASPSPTAYDQLAMSLAVLCRLRSANLTSRVWRLRLR